MAIVELIAEAHGWEVAFGDGVDERARFELSGLNWVDGAATTNPDVGEPVD